MLDPANGSFFKQMLMLAAGRREQCTTSSYERKLFYPNSIFQVQKKSMVFLWTENYKWKLLIQV
jgi:hypothetical protein